MKIRKLNSYKLFCFLIFNVLSSCGNKECEVQQIDKAIFNPINIKGDFIMVNQKDEIDTLKIEEFYEEFEKIQKRSLMVHQDCGHFFYYVYKFKGETISMDLEKNETKFIFKVTSLHMSNQYEINNSSKNFDKLLVTNGENCDESLFNKIVTKNFKVNYFLMKNGDKWIPKKFIQRKEIKY
ncbi:hypothetical protein [Flavobacterium oreochromis]|nr:hypothetical protein [Flavobacterium oreochromis]